MLKRGDMDKETMSSFLFCPHANRGTGFNSELLLTEQFYSQAIGLQLVPQIHTPTASTFYLLNTKSCNKGQ